MDNLFGVSMDLIMAVLLAAFLAAIAVVGWLALRNRVMVRLGLRNIPRRRGQTILIVIGVMLSTVIIAAALGTGDTLGVSIRNEAIRSLGAIDEIVLPARAGAGDSFGSVPYVHVDRFRELQERVADLDTIDGMTPSIAETVPALNNRSSVSEGRLNVVGVDAATLDGFAGFTSVTGEAVSIRDLSDGEAFINDRAADALDAAPGDELTLFLGGDATDSFRVAAVVERNGLAGRDPTLLVALERAQRLFDRPEQVNLISVSNRGGVIEGAELSGEVARELRAALSDREAAAALRELLRHPDVIDALAAAEPNLTGDLRDNAAELREELQQAEVTDRLIRLLNRQSVEDHVLDMLESEGLAEEREEASALFSDLLPYRVIQIKRNILETADEAGSFVTTIFLNMGLFTVMVGVLLIFLIFVMLAAARRSEMGMARAVGAKQFHLVQMFVFEGTAYALASAAVGVLLGLAVSALMVGIMNRIFSAFDDAGVFRLTPQFALRTMVVSYCLGMLITLATVAVSAYRVSRLNIVTAVRGLPNPPVLSDTGWRAVLLAPWRALLRPFRYGWRALASAARLRLLAALAYLARAAWAVVMLPVAVWVTIAQVIWRFLMQGWLAVLLGALLAWYGATAWERAAGFTAGVSLVVIGLALMLRIVLRRAGLRPETRDRIAFTFAGVVVLAFWLLPPATIEGVVGELAGGFDLLFVSGICMVTAAVWTVMYNADLLLRALTWLTSPVGKLRPVLVTAVAYPMSAKLRTGLTLAMFALVFFTLMFISVLTETFSTQFTDPEVVTGGWHVEGIIGASTPVADMRDSLVYHGLPPDDLRAVGGYTVSSVQAREPGSEWDSVRMRGADDGFLDASAYEFHLIAEGYGSTTAEVMQALRDDPSLVVLGGNLVRTRPDAQDGFRPEFMEGVFYADESMQPLTLELRQRLSERTTTVTVIGVVAREHEDSFSMLASKKLLDDLFPFPIPITRYRFAVADGVDAERIAYRLEGAFLENGMETAVLADELELESASARAIFRLFVGFVALGLVVGIAALGVVSTRAVVERRQQIGVLRAIGYRRGMIQLSLLLESSFISLLGIAIGGTLGVILGYQAFVEIRDEEAAGNLRFVVPWLQISAILVLAYVFSLLATWLPARQAARTYPAEALRYE